VALSGIDEQHLADANLAAMRSIIEAETAAGDDEGDRNRVAMLRHLLARIETQSHHAHRPAISDLLEAERARAIARI
jgi:hypothetical protein